MLGRLSETLVAVGVGLDGLVEQVWFDLHVYLQAMGRTRQCVVETRFVGGEVRERRKQRNPGSRVEPCKWLVCLLAWHLLAF
jgi:hypothetical protein